MLLTAIGESELVALPASSKATTVIGRGPFQTVRESQDVLHAAAVVVAPFLPPPVDPAVPGEPAR